MKVSHHLSKLSRHISIVSLIWKLPRVAEELGAALKSKSISTGSTQLMSSPLVTIQSYNKPSWDTYNLDLKFQQPSPNNTMTWSSSWHPGCINGHLWHPTVTWPCFKTISKTFWHFISMVGTDVSAKLAHSKPLVCLTTTTKKVINNHDPMVTWFMTITSYDPNGQAPLQLWGLLYL